MKEMILSRATKFFRRRGLRKSRYLYFKRLSSPISCPSLATSNGGVFASARISNFAASISILPVASSVFFMPSGLSFNKTSTEITHSGRNLSARFKSSLFFGLNTICAIPHLSLKSIKISLPWSRLLSTQPINVAVSPILFGVSLVRARIVFIILFRGQFHKKCTAIAKPAGLRPNAPFMVFHYLFYEIKAQAHAVGVLLFGNFGSTEFYKKLGHFVPRYAHAFIGYRKRQPFGTWFQNNYNRARFRILQGVIQQIHNNFVNLVGVAENAESFFVFIFKFYGDALCFG